jgi:hypothetical protein
MDTIGVSLAMRRKHNNGETRVIRTGITDETKSDFRRIRFEKADWA